MPWQEERLAQFGRNSELGDIDGLDLFAEAHIMAALLDSRNDDDVRRNAILALTNLGRYSIIPANIGKWARIFRQAKRALTSR